MYVRYFVPANEKHGGVWLRKIIGVYSGNNKDATNTNMVIKTYKIISVNTFNITSKFQLVVYNRFCPY